MKKHICLLLVFLIGVGASENVETETNTTYDPCCAFPCKNGGICSQKTLHSYECDCTDLGYTGGDCRIPYFSTKWDEFWSLTPEYKDQFLCGEGFLWGIINHVKSLHRNNLRKFYSAGSDSIDNPLRYNVKYDYPTFESHFESSPIGRALPQVPVNCPTPMGVLGPKLLPDESEVFEKIFRRKRFKTDPSGSNMFFVLFTEHLGHMLLKTEEPADYSYAKLPGGFDSDHIYGINEAIRMELRTMKGGKLKTSTINGQTFPPLLPEDVSEEEPPPPPEGEEPPPPPPEEAGDPKEGGEESEEEVEEKVEEEVEEQEPCQNNLQVDEEKVGTEEVEVLGCTADVAMEYPEETDGLKFAVGNPKIGKNPLLILISTIWIREHNRVAEMLAEEHPDWDDERLYQVSRLVITGELIHITLTDYLQQLTQYNLDIVWEPEAFNHDIVFQPDRINVEMHQLKHWHAMYPDCMKIGNTTYNVTEIFFNNKLLTRVGFDAVVDTLMRTPAGKVASRNYADHTREVIIETLREGRKYRLQSLNNYRKHLGLQPYKSMLDLCGEKILAKDLEQFYGDINAVEFFPGIAAEKTKCSVLSPTQMALGGPYFMKTLLSNPVNARGWWKPSTFGGPIGFQIVKGATIKELICQTRMETCKGEELISFHVPTAKEIEAELARKKARLWCLDEEDIATHDFNAM